MKAWAILIRERFHPALYFPMILAFTLCNVLYFTKSDANEFDLKKFFPVLLLSTSFFFRLRIFDEIKDFEVDKKLNPTRPLARGLMSVTKAKGGIAGLILVELILAGYLGAWSFHFHVLALCFSLLMFEEFFIGDLLRPHLTTYALTHTFVISLLGLSLGVSSSESPHINWQVILFILSHWMFFSLFEFARKTWAPTEERENVDSYSKIFSPRGAVGLSLISGLAAVLLLTAGLENPLLATFAAQKKYIVGLYIIYCVFCAPSFAHLSKQNFWIFRQASQAYLLLQYVLIVLIFTMGSK